MAESSTGAGGMMRVLSVAYPFAPVGPDAVGGAEQILAALDRGIVAAGHQSIVVAQAGSRVAGELVPVPPVSQVDATTRAATHRTMRRLIAEQMPHIDIVHCHGIDFCEILPPPGPPVLATLHLPPDWYPAQALAPDRARTWFNPVSWSQHAACPDTPSLLTPIGNGVPVARLAVPVLTRRGFVLTLGRICPEKGQHLAIQAARAAGVTLLIGGAVFGHDAHRGYFAQAVAPLLGPGCRYLGALGFARKRRLLSAARCLLLPSLAAETSSLVAMEAAACGTPVVAFRVGALAETIQDGVTGILVNDAAEMAAAIPRCDALDRAAIRAVAAERFQESAMVAAYLATYRLLLA